MDKNEKTGGWFKRGLLNRQENDEENKKENTVKEEKDIMADNRANLEQEIGNMLSKSNKDRVVADLVGPLENLVKDRQMLIFNNRDLEEKLKVANEAIERMKSNIENQEKRIEMKDNEIKSLEENMSIKQVGYDQLLEDYKEYQSVSKKEFEEISSRLDLEISKYKKFNEETADAQYKNLQKISSLEEKIRGLEIEKEQYSVRYEKVNEEKNALMKNINEFTKRMTLSIPGKNIVENLVEEVEEKEVKPKAAAESKDKKDKEEEKK